MKLTKRLLASILIACAITLAASAQDLEEWEINADVDNDGVVGPTDIQRVINGALGIRDRGPDAIDLPLRQYVVASPRASLAVAPQANEGSLDGCETVGAAYNFPRNRGRMLVKQGSVVVFRYDRNTEGVWYNNACGLLRSQLLVEVAHIPMRPVDGEGAGETDASPSVTKGELPDDPIDPERPDIQLDWVEAGRDGASGFGCGPAVGTAHIGVRHFFREPGLYAVRSTIKTYAIPARDRSALEDSDLCGAARAVDEVFALVYVVSRDVQPADFDWEALELPEQIHRLYGLSMTDDLDPTIVLPE